MKHMRWCLFVVLWAGVGCVYSASTGRGHGHSLAPRTIEEELRLRLSVSLDLPLFELMRSSFDFIAAYSIPYTDIATAVQTVTGNVRDLPLVLLKLRINYDNREPDLSYQTQHTDPSQEAYKETFYKHLLATGTEIPFFESYPRLFRQVAKARFNLIMNSLSSIQGGQLSNIQPNDRNSFKNIFKAVPEIIVNKNFDDSQGASFELDVKGIEFVLRYATADDLDWDVVCPVSISHYHQRAYLESEAMNGVLDAMVECCQTDSTLPDACGKVLAKMFHVQADGSCVPDAGIQKNGFHLEQDLRLRKEKLMALGHVLGQHFPSAIRTTLDSWKIMVPYEDISTLDDITPYMKASLANVAPESALAQYYSERMEIFIRSNRFTPSEIVGWYRQHPELKKYVQRLLAKSVDWGMHVDQYIELPSELLTPDLEASVEPFYGSFLMAQFSVVGYKITALDKVLIDRMPLCSSCIIPLISLSSTGKRETVEFLHRVRPQDKDMITLIFLENAQQLNIDLSLVQEKTKELWSHSLNQFAEYLAHPGKFDVGKRNLMQNSLQQIMRYGLQYTLLDSQEEGDQFAALLDAVVPPVHGEPQEVQIVPALREYFRKVFEQNSLAVALDTIQKINLPALDVAVKKAFALSDREFLSYFAKLIYFSDDATRTVCNRVLPWLVGDGLTTPTSPMYNIYKVRASLLLMTLKKEICFGLDSSPHLSVVLSYQFTDEQRAQFEERIKKQLPALRPWISLVENGWDQAAIVEFDRSMHRFDSTLAQVPPHEINAIVNNNGAASVLSTLSLPANRWWVTGGAAFGGAAVSGVAAYVALQSSVKKAYKQRAVLVELKKDTAEIDAKIAALKKRNRYLTALISVAGGGLAGVLVHRATKQA